MNKSIETVALCTSNERVHELTRRLYELAGKRVRLTFVKKNGTVRVMDCVPRQQYNASLGMVSTQVGKKMVTTKAHRDMITVAEILDCGKEGVSLRARTINLRTVIGDIEVIAC